MARKSKKKNIETLIENGYKLEEIKEMTSEDINEAIKALESAQKSISQIEEKDQLNLFDSDKLSANEEIISETKVPAITSVDPNWTKHVLTLFTADELENGCPRADGLRRVASLVLGEYSVDTDVVQVPTVENAGRATVISRIRLTNGQYYSGAADVFSGNTDRAFARHAVATAETRAEGRALRKALKLVKVLTAEEKSDISPEEADGTDQRIPSGMVNGIKAMGSKVGVDPFKIAIHLGFNVETLEGLSRKQAIEVSNQITKYTTKEIEIPDVVRA